MKTIRYPERSKWPELLKRPAFDIDALEKQGQHDPERDQNRG